MHGIRTGILASRSSLKLQLALLNGALVQLDQGDNDGQPDADEPALTSATRHSFEVPPVDELDLDQDGKIVKEPVAQEGESGQDLELLLHLRKFARLNLLDLHVLVEALAQTEKLSGGRHVRYGR